MSTLFDSFDASPQGAFIESPEGWRNDPDSSTPCRLEVMIYEREKAAATDEPWNPLTTYAIGAVVDIGAPIGAGMDGPYYRCIAAHSANVGNWKPESETQPEWILYWETARVVVDKEILAVDTANKQFTILGQHGLNSEIDAGNIVTVKNSTGNDGDYTVTAVTETGGTTTLTCSETISDPAQDGNLVCLQQARDKINAMSAKYLDESGGEYTGGASAPTLYGSTVANAARTEAALAAVLTPWTDTVVAVTASSTSTSYNGGGPTVNESLHAEAIAEAEGLWAISTTDFHGETISSSSAVAHMQFVYSFFDAFIGVIAGLYPTTTLTTLLQRKVRILGKSIAPGFEYVFTRAEQTFNKQGFDIPDENLYGFVLTEAEWSTGGTFDTEIFSTSAAGPWAGRVWPADPLPSPRLAEAVGWKLDDERRFIEWKFHCKTLAAA